ncbi:MAG TPA: transglycosylase SLT domain-containing protein [Pyrinomonadaceae bacterium]|nr:transglycosylase SLT domain-containing protein [Pyrinomonadaceae bacterium]
MKRSSFLKFSGGFLAILFTLAFICSPSFDSLQAVLGAQSRAVTDDDDLAGVRRDDRAGRAADGKLAQLSPAEHLRRANLYLTNRAFAEARAHYLALVERYPNDTNLPAALYGIGRSYFQNRQYEESLPWYERLARDYAQTKDGREGLYQLAAALLRAGRAGEAVDRYREYTERFPQGERIEGAYLNVIDGLREAGRPSEAIEWITRTRERFRTTATDTNAQFARLRLDVSVGDWQHAIEVADQLRSSMSVRTLPGVQTNLTEVAYLRAYSLERAGRTEEAINAYLAITDSLNSYYGGLATRRLLSIKSAARRPVVLERTSRVNAEIASSSNLYPVQYREAILRATARQRVDPRLILAIMRQESNFRPRAKSQAAARGLLQLTIDTALKYAPRAGLNNLQDMELYRPDTNILVGSVVLADLNGLFPDQPEAVAASYNGGEDNVARWLKRAGQKDAGVFASEVGFSETKDYVFKVMSNYRAYRQLYTADLKPKG